MISRLEKHQDEAAVTLRWLFLKNIRPFTITCIHMMVKGLMQVTLCLTSGSNVPTPRWPVDGANTVYIETHKRRGTSYDIYHIRGGEHHMIYHMIYQAGNII